MPALPLQSILVATDLTEASDPVVAAAAALARWTGAALHVVHAIEFGAAPYTPDPSEARTFFGPIHAAQRALDEQLERVLPPGQPVASRHTEISSAHRAILGWAEVVSADVIVLGPHRRRGALDQFLGTTADRVVRRARVPCLLVRGTLSLPLERVVAPVDFSEESRGSLRLAAAWAIGLAPDGRPALVEAVHVVSSVLDGPAFDLSIVSDELHREVLRALRRTGLSDVPIEESVVRGTPATEIVERAGSEPGALVVLATRGYGAIERVLLGSVASAVARAATCPVLLVPAAAARGRTRVRRPPQLVAEPIVEGTTG
ncbi:MAG TPA: universal stress protein [Longimicrobiales bacterium]|nr:universal stress protein [Longimicrobiales bacterium]